jgi:hypothetical protein
MKDTSTNQRKTAQLEQVLHELLAKNLQRGVFGIASLDVVISDGTIQGLKERWERTHK